MSISAIIPARMGSTRLPNKPLRKLGGIAMVHHVVNQAIKAEVFDNVYIATDSEEIIDYCSKHAINSIQTGQCQTGTDRVYKAAKQLDLQHVVNIQGDEPLMPISTIRDICHKLMSSQDSNIIMNAYSSCTQAEADDKNVVKVAFDNKSRAIYFSRNNIASGYDRTIPCSFKQMGIYGYTLETLQNFASLSRSILEDIERIELMRWLDYGNCVSMLKSEDPSFSVDTIDDLIKVESLMNS